MIHVRFEVAGTTLEDLRRRAEEHLDALAGANDHVDYDLDIRIESEALDGTIVRWEADVEATIVVADDGG